LAHVRAVLRRAAAAPSPRPQAVTVGDLHIDPDTRTVALASRPIDLAPKEFDLLYALAQQADRVVGIDELLERVWGPTWIGESQTLYVHIRWLREKIEEDPARPRRLLTVRSAGYRLVAA
jgi:DNA-binding response OmpR family regulator